jgi:hypothetical protein
MVNHTNNSNSNKLPSLQRRDLSPPDESPHSVTYGFKYYQPKLDLFTDLLNFGESCLVDKIIPSSSTTTLLDKEEAEFDCPGYNKEDVSCYVENNQLILTLDNKKRGKREAKLFLNKDADLEKISIKVENGVISIKAPKSEIKRHVVQIS